MRGADEKRAAIDAPQDAASASPRRSGLDAARVERKIALRRRFTWLKRRMSEEEVRRHPRALRPQGAALPVRGLTIEGEGHRFYPNRELAGPLLGFVSPDGEGKDGLELVARRRAQGHAREVRGLRDRSGRLLFCEGIEDEQALAGHNVYLTIDQGIQYTAERELDAAMRTYEANGGSVVVLDPNTGEILALASSPGYNPNDYGDERGRSAARPRASPIASSRAAR